MAKKLTATELSKLTAKFNERKTISVCNDQYIVEIHTLFRDSLMDNIVLDYFTVLQEMQNDPEDHEEMNAAILLLNALILREFTNLPIPRKMDAAKLVQVTRNLLDTGIMQEVFQHFEPAELEKVGQKLEKASHNINRLSSQNALQGAASEASGEWRG